MNRDEILNIVDPPDKLGDMVLNAFILAGFNFFSTLAGLGATGLLADPKTGLVAAFVASGLSFFGSLLTQKGLKKPE